MCQHQFLCKETTPLVISTGSFAAFLGEIALYQEIARLEAIQDHYEALLHYENAQAFRVRQFTKETVNDVKKVNPTFCQTNFVKREEMNNTRIEELEKQIRGQKSSLRKFMTKIIPVK